MRALRVLGVGGAWAVGTSYFLFIRFLLFDPICTPSTTSSAGRAALRLPALVLDYFICTGVGIQVVRT